MTPRIEIETAKGRKLFIPNSWDQLSSRQFIALMDDILAFGRGKLSPAKVRILFVCRELGVYIRRIKDEDALANLVWLSEQVTFPFVISYPDNDDALKSVAPALRDKYKRIPPERMQGDSLARYLCKLDYNYALDGCFCAQMIPSVTVESQVYPSYTIDRSFDVLTCSLTALQFIDARELAMQGIKQLPLLAAVLYCPSPYQDKAAKELATSFAKLPQSLLQAIAFNFSSFCNWLFKCTEYALLTEGKSERKAISTDARASLYNLSKDGLGDINEVEQMNVLTYLSLLRKKVIESVRSLHDAKMKLTDISSETGLSIETINKMI
jgi:hypothetical protein